MDNKDTLRKHLESLTRADWTTYESMLTDSAVYEEEPTQQVSKGPAQIVKAVQIWKTAFPDMDANIKDMVAAADAVVAELEWSGTHSGTLTGPMGSLPATGRHGKVAGVVLARFENGKIREIHHYFDLMTILTQLGVFPKAGTPATP